jgi:C1A family cysteine protease
VETHRDSDLDSDPQQRDYTGPSSWPTWIIKNSWSTQFGHNGFADLKFGVNACGLGQTQRNTNADTSTSA